jgi:hypothetical protein
MKFRFWLKMAKCNWAMMGHRNAGIQLLCFCMQCIYGWCIYVKENVYKQKYEKLAYFLLFRWSMERIMFVWASFLAVNQGLHISLMFLGLYLLLNLVCVYIKHTLNQESKNWPTRIMACSMYYCLYELRRRLWKFSLIILLFLYVIFFCFLSSQLFQRQVIVSWTFLS